MRTRDRVALVAAVGAALLIAGDWIPGVRGPESWRWARRPLASPAGLWWLAPIFLAQVGVALRLARVWATGSQLVRLPWGAAAVALAFAQMVTLTAIEPGGLANVPRRVLDPSFTSYHTIARDVDDVREFLADYPRLQRRFPVHGPSQPPGRVLFFRAVNEWAGASEARTRRLLSWGERLGGVPPGPPGTTDGQRAGALVAGFLLMGLGALALVPLVSVLEGRCEPTGVAAGTLLMGTLPSFLLFTPQTDHLILLLTTTAAALLLEAMRHAGHRLAPALAFGAGASAGLAVFVSFTSLAALVTWGIAAAGMVGFARRRRVPFPSRGRVARLAGAGAVGAAIPLGAVAAAGLDWPAVFRECVAAAHRVQVLVHGREYSTWVVWNLWDFALFAGWPLVVVAAARARDEGIAWRAAAADPARPAPPGTGPVEAPFALALLVAVLVLDVSGRILGETGRIWMFMMPLAVAAAAASFGRGPLRRALPLAVAQWGVLVALRAFLDVPG